MLRNSPISTALQVLLPTEASAPSALGTPPSGGSGRARQRNGWIKSHQRADGTRAKVRNRFTQTFHSAAKPQPTERGSVNRSALPAKRATGVFQNLAAGDAAAGHRPALRRIFAAREDFNGYSYKHSSKFSLTPRLQPGVARCCEALAVSTASHGFNELMEEFSSERGHEISGCSSFSSLHHQPSTNHVSTHSIRIRSA